MMNHLKWVERAETMKLHAVILTGWSRFSHTAALCELLPVALPCLSVCLSILRFGECTEQVNPKP